MPAPRDNANPLAPVLSARHLKTTRQRNLIAETFLSGGGHVSADELLARVRAENPRVSAATIYRTMKLLADAGLARAVRFGDGQTRWEPDATRDHHDHLVCTGCGLVREFENDRIESLQQAIAAEHGFELSHHRMELYGLCPDCQRQSKRSSSSALRRRTTRQ